MKVHYFQRYSQKENVATSNTMLLLSRLYNHNPLYFYSVINILLGNTNELDGVNFNIQPGTASSDSVPDAEIKQNSFKIEIETKLEASKFNKDQLTLHLNSFLNSCENIQVLLTLAETEMSSNINSDISQIINNFNSKYNKNVIHINTTFEKIGCIIQEQLDPSRDYDFIDILNDFLDYCDESSLVDNSRNVMLIHSAGTTIDFNIKNGIYYRGAEDRYRKHAYLGLYTNKAVRAIGLISNIIVAGSPSHQIDKLEFTLIKGKLTEEIKTKIINAIKDGSNYNYDLLRKEHTYFFVEKFIDCKFEKQSFGGVRKWQYLDIRNKLNVKELPNSVEDIAKELNTLKW